MAKIQLVKNNNGAMVPLDDDDADRVKRLAVGEIIEATVRFYRNPGFHRKFLKMLRFGYEQYSDSVEDGMRMSFEKFRKDIVCLAGYAHPVVDVDGETRLEAQSISYAEMEEDEFVRLYESCARVLLTHILRNWTKADLERAVQTADDFVVGFMA